MREDYFRIFLGQEFCTFKVVQASQTEILAFDHFIGSRIRLLPFLHIEIYTAQQQVGCFCRSTMETVSRILRTLCQAFRSHSQVSHHLVVDFLDSSTLELGILFIIMFHIRSEFQGHTQVLGASGSMVWLTVKVRQDKVELATEEMSLTLHAIIGCIVFFRFVRDFSHFVQKYVHVIDTLVQIVPSGMVIVSVAVMLHAHFRLPCIVTEIHIHTFIDIIWYNRGSTIASLCRTDIIIEDIEKTARCGSRRIID